MNEFEKDYSEESLGYYFAKKFLGLNEDFSDWIYNKCDNCFIRGTTFFLFLISFLLFIFASFSTLILFIAFVVDNFPFILFCVTFFLLSRFLGYVPKILWKFDIFLKDFQEMKEHYKKEKEND